jgi:putative PIN family toxin of toxin-antitoxin system
MTRALLDAHVYLSYLLAPDSNSPPTLAVVGALTDSYTLLLTAGVISELRDKSENKPYLAARITLDQTDQLVQVLSSVAKWVPELDPPLPEVGRDRKDDYLFAHAIFGKADYLVSGDTGVQKVSQIGSVRIVSPAMFLQVLESAPPTSRRD